MFHSHPFLPSRILIAILLCGPVSSVVVFENGGAIHPTKATKKKNCHISIPFPGGRGGAGEK